jgi:hypothetical protein
MRSELHLCTVTEALTQILNHCSALKCEATNNIGLVLGQEAPFEFQRDIYLIRDFALILKNYPSQWIHSAVKN